MIAKDTTEAYLFERSAFFYINGISWIFASRWKSDRRAVLALAVGVLISCLTRKSVPEYDSRASSK